LDDLEFIFVDDGSTDDSAAIIEQTLADFPHRKEQVQIIHHEHNMGLPQTRKDAMDVVQGEYFIFMDGDDWVEPRYAELLYARAQETGADLVSCNYYFHYPNKVEPCDMAPHGEGPDGANIRDDTLNRRIHPNVWIRLLRTDFVRQHPILWPKKGMAEDVVMSSQFAYYAQRLAHVPEPLYQYRFNTDSIGRSKDEKHIERAFNEFLVNHQVLMEFMHKEGLEERYENGIFINKVAARNMLLPIIGKPKYWWKCVSTFPEVNWMFLFGNKNRKPTWRERVWILDIMLGLYPLLNKFIRKHCRTGREWWP